ncbi:MAG: MBL fold metallo-hydrolase [Gammaproteobacteria bacterium]|nr:MBL fold metallo-hydrolase [Gammaproteobacteria bacterium]
MNRWHIGDIKITRIVEMQVTGGSRFILPDATREAVLPIKWLSPHFMDDEGRLIMSIHALVIETPDRTIIVDTCLGNDKPRDIPNWNMLHGPFLADLVEAGYPRETIDTVLCTHLHVDHVGWNTMLVDGKWLPTFPNARYLMAKKEYQYWTKEADEGKYGEVIADSVLPVFNAGLVDLVDMNYKITDEIWLEPTPGHTPGHVSVHIKSQGEEALITGDCIHHPCQIAKPEWSSSADYNAEEGIVTRNNLLRKYADASILIIGTHFATPAAGHLKRDGDQFWLQAFVDGNPD